MPKILWSVGELFSFDTGYGVVLSGDNKALLVTGEGGRTGFIIGTGPIPIHCKPWPDIPS